MTKNEIIEKIDNVKTSRFYLSMKDRWTDKDFEQMRKYNDELWRLEHQLQKMEQKTAQAVFFIQQILTLML